MKLTSSQYVTDMDSLQSVFIQVNYEGLANSCLSPVSLCPARHSNPFEVSMQMS